MELHYEMDDQFKEVYQLFGNHFGTFPVRPGSGNT